VDDCVAGPYADAPLKAGNLLPIARYRFAFRMHDELFLPEFAGSLLRGQFGAALRRTACMTGEKLCSACPLYRTCPYPAIFETPPPLSHPLQKFSQVPNPYVIEPPPIGTRVILAGDLLSFGLVLFGNALGQLPLIAFAMQRAFHHGVGTARAKASLEAILWEGPDALQPVWDIDGSRVEAHEAGIEVPAFEAVNAIALRIDTPLRLQHQQHPLRPSELRPRTLVTALMRRASLLFEFHAAMPSIAGNATAQARHAESLEDCRELRWVDWTRFSSRQQQEMTLGGVVGRWVLRGDLTPLMIWLWLGQWLHVGKNATMGMGSYTLEHV
jgi:CRISPR-associated endoribonuclease Cas6